MVRYILTRMARNHLREVREYLAVAPAHVREREINKLLACFAQATEFPFSGRSEPEVRTGTNNPRSLLSYPYRIYYYPETSPLEIFAIRHGRRKTPVSLKDF